MKLVIGAGATGLVAGTLGAWLAYGSLAETQVIQMPPERCEQVPLQLEEPVELEVAALEFWMRQLETGIGRPMPWDEADVPDEVRPDALVAAATQALDAVDGELLSVDCDEYPCILAFEFPADGPRPWPTGSPLGDTVRQSWSLPDDDDETDILIQVLADGSVFDVPGSRGRYGARGERLLMRLWEERS